MYKGNQQFITKDGKRIKIGENDQHIMAGCIVLPTVLYPNQEKPIIEEDDYYLTFDYLKEIIKKHKLEYVDQLDKWLKENDNNWSLRSLI